MSNWINAGSIRVRLVADPNQLTATGHQGNLMLDYKNDSYVAQTVDVRKLRSSDPAVATPASTPTPPPPIYIPGRPRQSHSFAPTPAAGSKPIGIWSPVGQGFATLDADMDIHDRALQRLSAVTPSDDVEVR